MRMSRAWISALWAVAVLWTTAPAVPVAAQTAEPEAAAPAAETPVSESAPAPAAEAPAVTTRQA